MYRHILVPLDGSEAAQRGLEEALRLAVEQQSDLILMFVLADEYPSFESSSASAYESFMTSLRQHGERVLTEAYARARERGIPALTILRETFEPRIARAIVDEVEKSNIDLIVMGTHGRRGLSHLLLGSDAELVVRTSPVPVLTVGLPKTVRPIASHPAYAQENLCA